MPKPRILMLDVAYWNILNSFYNSIDKKGQLEFGIGYYLSKAFIKNGWPAHHFFVNDLEAQISWLKSHDRSNRLFASLTNYSRFSSKEPFSTSRKYFNHFLGLHIARIQIQYFKPDIIWFLGPSYVPPIFVKTLPINKSVLKIAHISSPLPNIEWFRNYDLMLSSQNINILKWGNMNLRAQLFKPAIDAESCLSVDFKDRTYSLSFIGSITNDHSVRLRYLEEISKKFDIHLFGPGVENIPEKSPIKNRWKHPIWGPDLFSAYANSKISINIHGDNSLTEAANVRLLEITGCGSLLFTENTQNILDYFERDQIVTYDSLEDLLEKISYHNANEQISEGMAIKARKKTISAHTYDQRVIEISDTLLNLL